ncbi:hypothetical protein [Mycobacteroides salmoniphilum]|uniref:hypothetical protein n=1 Tax=Mycobacteroides salmoniphilum TaxID=404941 RepID=UPI0012FF5F10|nr:hypothetical protein [Mycobacteroides salmoniphilum]
MNGIAPQHLWLARRYGDTDILFTLRQAGHFLSYWANAEQSATNPFEGTSLSANIAVYPDLIEIAATLATHRQQIASRRIAWPLALLQEINEHTGQNHTDITPIEQWVHNQRLNGAAR